MKISAVITCYESLSTIGLVILSLATQTRRPDEIIVTDDGSCDETQEYIKGLLNTVSVSHGVSTVFLSHERTIPYRLNTIRNAGITHSTGDIIFLFDGDILVPREILESHVEIHRQLLQNSGRGYVSCVRKNLRGDGVIGEGRISEWGHQLDRFLLSSHWQDLNLEPEHTLSQASFLKSDWDKAGGFDTDFDGHWGFDEIEFAHRLKSTGTVLTSHGTVLHLAEDAALGNRDDSRNRSLYLKKKNDWLEKIKSGASGV